MKTKKLSADKNERATFTTINVVPVRKTKTIKAFIKVRGKDEYIMNPKIE